MHRLYIATTLLVTIAWSSGMAATASGQETEGDQAATEAPAVTGSTTVGQLLRPKPSAAFVGKSLILWNGRVGVAFDVESEEWSILPDNPRAEAAEEPSVLALTNGHLLAAYFSDPDFTNLRIDAYLPETEDWKALAEISRTALEEDRQRMWLSIGGIVQIEDGVVVLVGSSGSCTLRGIQLPRAGGWNFISVENAPEHSGRDSFTYHRQGSVLYGGYAQVTLNLWGVWSQQDDKWGKSEEMPPCYGFGHCSTGNEVYVFSGVSGSMIARIHERGWVYSFSKGSWHPWPMEGGPGGRRGAAVCWTGEEVFVWGGLVKTEGDPSGRVRTPRNTGSLFDPIEQGWTPMTTDGAPFPRARSVCVWTGKEVIIWGGRADGEGLTDAHAYDPKADKWRDLPSVLTVLGP